ncbi:Hypothetical protein DEACI_2977 [Acididesulfobacillus acetoxydans]|uniref:Uncharacterized protein n=1 Tax=Acididesulfobacillus acetoxydans TaxID=1561005 RepID=A0A8S0VXT9_9FIRM|nr:Hypothetical protein DEACI_2977 [Acididesulfobacillus acetoxydans]CEJ07479.1 Hypothetical protein DEACI_1945 [Acididesulfobacillus acetoxydans]
MLLELAGFSQGEIQSSGVVTERRCRFSTTVYETALAKREGPLPRRFVCRN